MVRDYKKGHRTWWWMLLGAAGLALVMTAILLWPSTSANPGTPVVQAQVSTDTPTPTPTRTPTITPTPNAGCIPEISKSDSPTKVGLGGQITYTLKVENTGTDDCPDVVVTDPIPDGTDCVDASVTDDAGTNIEVDGCDNSGTVTWDMDSDDELKDDDELELKMVVELEDDVDDGDTITNEDACVTADNEADPADCDEETTTVDEDVATKTATPGPTATTRPPGTVAAPPPPVAPLPPAPSAGQLPSVAAPATGSGADSGGGGSQPLALALGLTGGLLLLLSGAAMLRRPR